MARRRPIDADILWTLERVGSLSLSADGSAVVCAVTGYDMKENKGRTSLWLLPTDTCAPRRLTRCGEKDANPAWSPKGDRIAFLAKREQEGSKDEESQLYVIDAKGGEAERVSDFGPGVAGFRWMPDGRRIVFVSWVWPKVRGHAAQDREAKAFRERKESAYVTSEAQYRHFDKNLPMGRVPHLLMLDVASGRITDLFEGKDYALPLVEPGAGHFDVSPDGRRIAFAHDPSPRKRSDNPYAISEIDLATRRVTPVTLDSAWSYEAPRYSPDGQHLACVATNIGRRHTMFGRIAFLARGVEPKLTARNDRLDVEGPLRWALDSSSILFAAQEKGRCHLWRHDVASGNASIAVRGGWIQGFDIGGRPGAEIIALAVDSAEHPVQVHAIRGPGARRVERFNDRQLAQVRLGETREATIKGSLGDPVQFFLTFPPGFDAKRKYPILQMIHGGPYAASGDTFGYRWNPHVFAARGYVVVSVNYHGSSGFGFAFRDSIMGRQGQLETRDIEAATDWVLRKRWADRRRAFASGGSYGGFLVAWMNGNIPAGRYRAYVCHAGVFDRLLTFSADSFLQRPKDLGAFYWADSAKVRAQSPSTYAHRMRTPTLVIHGTNDYRVPDANGLAYYNTLQARGVPSKLIWFPDENHWVLKPRNSWLWYQEFLDWLAVNDLPKGRRSR